MKILLTTHQFLPEYSSGTEIIAYNIAKELQSRGHDVTVLTGFPAKTQLADADRFDAYTYDGLPVERFLHAHVPMGGQDNILQAEYDNRFFYRWFKEYLTQHRPDVVHFIHLSRLSASAIDACKELNIPTVFTATDFWFVCPMNQLKLNDNSMCLGPNRTGTNCVRHMVATTQSPETQAKIKKLPDFLLAMLISLCKRGFFAHRPKARWVQALAQRPASLSSKINMIDRVLVPSHIMGEILAAHGLESQRVTYLPYGISVRHITHHADKGQYPKLRVGFVGTLFEHKGPQVLVKAIKSLPLDLPIELKIHGKTEEFPTFMTQLRQLIADDPRITVCGAFKNTQIGEILAGLDVLVCPSIWYENTPLVIYEAMAGGVPVIATNLGGMAESVDANVNGFLFEAGNHVELAGHLQRLAGDRAMLGRLASKTKPPLSVPEHVSTLEDVYASLATPALLPQV